MPDRDPIEATNLDIYGSDPLPWSRARERLAAEPAGPETPFFLGTMRPDGPPTPPASAPSGTKATSISPAGPARASRAT